jgi:hypothetical protein
VEEEVMVAVAVVVHLMIDQAVVGKKYLSYFYEYDFYFL